MTRIHTASFYEPQNWVGQPFRVSWQHPRGLKVQWKTLPFVYPTSEQIRAYRGGDITYETYADRYRAFLEERLAIEESFQRWLEQVTALDDVTLLCFEREKEPCHRRELARWLVEKTPKLELGLLR